MRETASARPVLIIDDDPEICTLVTTVLTREGLPVESALDGETGIEKARIGQPVVILLDMMMPGLDGIATCQRLKQDPILKHIPVVGITASPDLRFTAKAFRAGADFFLAKPFGVKTLLHVVDLATDHTRRRGRAKQRQPRLTAEIPVRCSIADTAGSPREIVGQTGNVSIGGVLLLLPEAVAPGTVCRLRLDLPDGTLTAECAVVWQNPQPVGRTLYRHGVRLLQFAEDNNDLERYRQFLSDAATGRVHEADA